LLPARLQQQSAAQGRAELNAVDDDETVDEKTTKQLPLFNQRLLNIDFSTTYLIISYYFIANVGKLSSITKMRVL